MTRAIQRPLSYVFSRPCSASLEANSIPQLEHILTDTTRKPVPNDGRSRRSPPSVASGYFAESGREEKPEGKDKENGEIGRLAGRLWRRSRTWHRSSEEEKFTCGVTAYRQVAQGKPVPAPEGRRAVGTGEGRHLSSRCSLQMGCDDNCRQFFHCSLALRTQVSNEMPLRFTPCNSTLVSSEKHGQKVTHLTGVSVPEDPCPRCVTWSFTYPPRALAIPCGLTNLTQECSCRGRKFDVRLAQSSVQSRSSVPSHISESKGQT